MTIHISGHLNEKKIYTYIDNEDKTLSRQERHFFDKMKQKKSDNDHIKGNKSNQKMVNILQYLMFTTVLF